MLTSTWHEYSNGILLWLGIMTKWPEKTLAVQTIMMLWNKHKRLKCILCCPFSVSSMNKRAHNTKLKLATTFALAKNVHPDWHSWEVHHSCICRNRCCSVSEGPCPSVNCAVDCFCKLDELWWSFLLATSALSNISPTAQNLFVIFSRVTCWRLMKIFQDNNKRSDFRFQFRCCCVVRTCTQFIPHTSKSRKLVLIQLSIRKVFKLKLTLKRKKVLRMILCTSPWKTHSTLRVPGNAWRLSPKNMYNYHRHVCSWGDIYCPIDWSWVCERLDSSLKTPCSRYDRE